MNFLSKSKIYFRFSAMPYFAKMSFVTPKVSDYICCPLNMGFVFWLFINNPNSYQNLFYELYANVQNKDKLFFIMGEFITFGNMKHPFFRYNFVKHWRENKKKNAATYHAWLCLYCNKSFRFFLFAVCVGSIGIF